MICKIKIEIQNIFIYPFKKILNMSDAPVSPPKTVDVNKKSSKVEKNLNDPIQARIHENYLNYVKSSLWKRRRSNKVRPTSR